MNVTRDGNEVRLSNDWAWRNYTLEEAREFVVEIESVIEEIENEKVNADV